MQFSPIAAEHIHTPRNAGRMDDATHIGVGGTPGEGPYVRLYMKIMGNQILKASYECNGCPSSIAAGSMAAQVLSGRTVDRAALVTPRDVLLILGGLPEGKEWYADLAVAAIQDALRDGTNDEAMHTS